MRRWWATINSRHVFLRFFLSSCSFFSSYETHTHSKREREESGTARPVHHHGHDPFLLFFPRSVCFCSCFTVWISSLLYLASALFVCLNAVQCIQACLKHHPRKSFLFLTGEKRRAAVPLTSSDSRCRYSLISMFTREQKQKGRSNLSSFSSLRAPRVMSTISGWPRAFLAFHPALLSPLLLLLSSSTL